MPKKIVIASDSFKGSLTSVQVAAAAGLGIKDVLPDCQVVSVNVADGGEGTLQAISDSSRTVHMNTMVSDPLGRKIKAGYGMTGNGLTAIIESAEAIGLTLLDDSERNPLTTSSHGLGELIRHAYENGCRDFIIGLGGSATNDGGTGMLEALGFRFFDVHGHIISGCCGDILSEIDRMDTDEICIGPCSFTIACDVDTPFYGPEGASHIFARQKGADSEAVAKLEKGMESFAGIIRKQYGHELGTIPGSGAAGGLGGAFHAVLGARLMKGIDLILDRTGFDRITTDADLVITGEGRIDGQTAKGKTAYGILQRASARGIPVVAVAGLIDHDDAVDSLGFKHMIQISPTPKDEAGLREVMNPATASENIRKAVADYISSLDGES